MIDRKDLKVGLTTSCGKVVTAIGRDTILYTRNECPDVERYMYIDDFCEKHSIKKKTVEVTGWVNVYEHGMEFAISKECARRMANKEAIAVAVELRGSYEV